MSNREAGKGCKPRPFSVPQEEFDNHWDTIFGKNKKPHETGTNNPIDFPKDEESKNASN